MADQATMIPMLRAGLGPLIGNPVTGYMMLLKTIGRKSGLPRYTPMNYAVMSGSVYCLARWGVAADWYQNLIARPDVEVTLPGRTFSGVAKTVNDLDERAQAIRQVLKNGGFAGFSQGFNPFTVPRGVLLAGTAQMIVVRIQATGIAPGASDPGGWGWIIPVLAGTWLISKWLRRRKS
jgi:deazaflavin-dependent oxidoreductase (nitroreductase family)